MTKLLVYFEATPEIFGHLMSDMAMHVVKLDNFRVETSTTPLPPMEELHLSKMSHPAGKRDIPNLGKSKVARLILDACQNNPTKSITYLEAETLMTANGLKAKNVSSTLTYMKRRDLVRVKDKTIILLEQPN